MTTRTLGAAAAFVLAAGSLTGCAGSGANSNFQRPASTATTRINPPTALPTAATPASSGWAQRTTPAAPPQGDPSALAAPMGNTPQFSNQPAVGIGPAGGLAPQAALPSITGPAGPVPAAPAPGASTSNLIPVGSSINSLNGSVPVSAAPAPGRQVAVNAIRTADGSPRANVPIPAAPLDDSANGPTMPPASIGSDPPLQPPQPITQLSPVMLGTPPPTTVRQ